MEKELTLYQLGNLLKAVTENYEVSLMSKIKLSDLFMIGKSSSRRLNELGILTIQDLALTDPNYLYKYFKNRANQMIESANGIDNSKVEYEYTDPKSISSSTSFAYNYKTKEEIYPIIKSLSKEITTKLKEKKMYTKSVSIWIKYTDFTKVSKQITLTNSTNELEYIYMHAIKLFNSIWNEESIRALCVGISTLSKTNDIQLNLFSHEKIKETPKITNEKLDKVINDLAVLVKNTKDEVLYEEDKQESHILYKFKYEKPYTIIRENNVYIIKGDQIEKLFKMTNFNTDEAFDRFSKKLRRMGIDDELEKMGINEGDIVRILDYEFEYTK